jgi:hypothetical protein
VTRQPRTSSGSFIPLRNAAVCRRRRVRREFVTKPFHARH